MYFNLTLMNPFYSLENCFFEIHIHIVLLFMCMSPIQFFFSKMLYTFFISCMHATCSAQSISLNVINVIILGTEKYYEASHFAIFPLFSLLFVFSCDFTLFSLFSDPFCLNSEEFDRNRSARRAARLGTPDACCNFLMFSCIHFCLYIPVFSYG